MIQHGDPIISGAPDLNLLCGNCYPPHAMREHHKICQMAACPCRGFVALPAAPVAEPEPAKQTPAPDADNYGWYAGF